MPTIRLAGLPSEARSRPATGPPARFALRWAPFARICERTVVVAAVALVSPAHHAAAQSAVERELIQLERDWDEAFFRNDTAFIDRVLAAEFIATYPDGSRGDRAKELANAAAFNQQIESSTLSEFTVRVHGDTAIVWFTRRLAGPSKGKRIEVVHRYLDVFVRRDGRWQCVATQSVRVPE